MNCVDWEERIALHAGGDLAPAEAAEVDRHLAACPGCRGFSTGLRDTLAGLRDTHSEAIPAAAFTAVRAGVIAEIERTRRVWRRLAWISGVGVAAALFLALALKPGPLPAPPQRVAFAIPQAPEAPKIVRPAAAKPARLPHREPVLVKLQTSDPKTVIYWIAD